MMMPSAGTLRYKVLMLISAPHSRAVCVLVSLISDTCPDSTCAKTCSFFKNVDLRKEPVELLRVGNGKQKACSLKVRLPRGGGNYTTALQERADSRVVL